MPIENLYTTDCIRTVSGVYVNVFEPKPEMFNIEDIAHALSHQCRFGGHLPVFFSVAEHCINCDKIIHTPHRFDALMHDCSEAYLLDIPKPIKDKILDYLIIEDNLMKVLSAKFGFNYPLSDEVKKVDKAMLEWEWQFIMLEHKNFHLPTFSPAEAKQKFIELFKLLKP